MVVLVGKEEGDTCGCNVDLVQAADVDLVQAADVVVHSLVQALIQKEGMVEQVPVEVEEGMAAVVLANMFDY